MTRWRRRAGFAAAAAGLAGIMSVSAALLAQPEGTPAAPAGGNVAAGQPVGRAESAAGVEALQERLIRLPGDWDAWATLGSAYVSQARQTADARYYTRASEAFEKSLELRPEDNAPALIGQGTLAASRHDFVTALELGQQAQRLNDASPAAHGLLVDALIELGRYDEAATQLQRMVDLRPDVASFTRVSYYRDLTGDTEVARAALEQAGRFAFSPEDSAFVEQYLGELAFNEGDVEQAATHFEAGLRHTPGSPRLLAGRAKVEAANGDIDAALTSYREATTRLPEPGYLIAYGELLQSEGREAEAAEQYAVVDAVAELFRAAGANPDLELALYDADHGRPDAALELAEREWQIRRSVHTEDAYAWALHVNGRSEEALEHARAADALGGANALFAFHRGMIQKSLGLREEARASLNEALDINPYFSPLHAKTATEALDDLGRPG